MKKQVDQKAAEYAKMKDFFEKREATLLKENKEYEDKIKMMNTDSNLKVAAQQTEMEKKMKNRLKLIEDEWKKRNDSKENKLTKEFQDREKALQDEVKKMKELLDLARKEAEELAAAKRHAERERDALLEEVMDYRTYCCVIVALVQKPSRDFPLKQGREQSPEIDIPSW